MRDDTPLHDARLRELAPRLGARAAEELDVERTAQAVVARLRTEPRAEVWVWLKPAWLRIAATIVIVAGAVVIARSAGRGPVRVAELAVPGDDDLTGFTPSQLRETIDALDQPWGDETGISTETGLEGLGADELRALLRSLEG